MRPFEGQVALDQQVAMGLFLFHPRKLSGKRRQGSNPDTTL